MKLRVILGLAVVLAAGPALAQKVFIDYDKQYDLDGIKTFAWYTTEDTSLARDNPLLHSRIVNSIEQTRDPLVSQPLRLKGFSPFYESFPFFDKGV